MKFICIILNLSFYTCFMIINVSMAAPATPLRDYYLNYQIYSTDASSNTMPECASGDIGGPTMTNTVSICCAYTRDANGRQVCAGTETCTQKSINCYDSDGSMGLESKYYSVKGDPYDCKTDASCQRNGAPITKNDFEVLEIN